LTHKCKRCKKKFGTYQALSGHLSHCQKSVRLACDGCGRILRSPQGLGSHKSVCKALPGRKRFICPHCEAVFSDPHAFGGHKGQCARKRGLHRWFRCECGLEMQGRSAPAHKRHCGKLYREIPAPSEIGAAKAPPLLDLSESSPDQTLRDIMTRIENIDKEILKLSSIREELSGRLSKIVSEIQSLAKS